MVIVAYQTNAAICCSSSDFHTCIMFLFSPNNYQAGGNMSYLMEAMEVANKVVLEAVLGVSLLVLNYISPIWLLVYLSLILK